MRHFIEFIVDADEIADTLTLAYEQRQKSRQRLTLDSGAEAGLMLPTGKQLRDGDLLGSKDGTVVRIVAKPEPLSKALCRNTMQLARACYHLGNRHVAIAIHDDGVCFQPDHVLEEMLRGLGIDAIRIEAPFDPESGAYSHSGTHAHSH